MESYDREMKETISIELKERVFKISNGKCYFCKTNLKNKEFGNNHYHHFIPEVCGGQTTEDNLVLCCYNCHSIIHSKTKLTYGEIRANLYNLFCILLDILPCKYSWDDDLESAKEELNKNPKEIPTNWKQLIFCLKFIDRNIGLIDIPYKIKDFNLLGKDYFNLTPKTIEDFIILNKNPNDFYEEINKKMSLTRDDGGLGKPPNH